MTAVVFELYICTPRKNGERGVVRESGYNQYLVCSFHCLCCFLAIKNTMLPFPVVLSKLNKSYNVKKKGQSSPCNVCLHIKVKLLMNLGKTFF